jgi:hypothetical protein
MDDKKLVRKLTWLVLIKIVVLYLLWLTLLKDQKVEVTAEAMSQVIENKSAGATNNDQ